MVCQRNKGMAKAEPRADKKMIPRFLNFTGQSLIDKHYIEHASLCLTDQTNLKLNQFD